MIASSARTRGKARAVVAGAAWLLGRSLFPGVALVLIVSTAVLGPWATLVLAALWWNVVTRVG